MEKRKVKFWVVFLAAFIISFLVIGAVLFGVSQISENAETLNDETSEKRKLSDPLPISNVLFILEGSDEEKEIVVFNISFFEQSKILVTYIPNETECGGKSLAEVYKKKKELGVLYEVEKLLPYETDHYVYSTVENVLSLPFLPYIKYDGDEKIGAEDVFNSIQYIADEKISGSLEYNYRYFTDKCKTDFLYYDFFVSKEKLGEILSYEDMKVEKTVFGVKGEK